MNERDLQPEVEASLTLPDTHNTVQISHYTILSISSSYCVQVGVRAGLAQEYVKVSREQAKVCESHILDQHLQHQVRTAQHRGQ